MGVATLYTVTNLLGEIGNIIRLSIPILLGLAVLAFFWGLVTYIWSEGSKESGKTLMIWGIISIFIMVSLWGIISLIGQNLGITSNSGALNPPVVNGLP